jgi:hypothetical protein
LRPITAAQEAWNEAVAFLIDGFSRYTLPGLDAWHHQVADALRSKREPLRSDFILSPISPKLASTLMKGHVRAFNTTILEENLEFMPKELDYPKFPYFQVEPATLQSLAQHGLVLFANPGGIAEDEPDVPGTPLDLKTYCRRSIISMELEMRPLAPDTAGAVLLNWSCKGRNGAQAKVFIDGIQHVGSFEVRSTDDDAVPNFWTFLPWKQGVTSIDLKHVGAGYLWFEHVDVHHIEWSTVDPQV